MDRISGRLTAEPCGLCLQDAVPALAVFGRLMNGAASGALLRAQVLVVPLDLLPGPVGHVAEVVRLGVQPEYWKFEPGTGPSPLRS